MFFQYVNTMTVQKLILKTHSIFYHSCLLFAHSSLENVLFVRRDIHFFFSPFSSRRLLCLVADEDALLFYMAFEALGKQQLLREA